MGNYKHSLNILHQNIQGITSKVNELETLVNTHKLDILCFSEIFIKHSNINKLQIAGYRLADSFCRSKSRGGVCIYVKNELNFKKLDSISYLSMELNFECCGIILPELNYVVICIYRTPNSNFEIFIKTLETLLYKVTLRSRFARKRIIILGDFNINTLENNQKAEIFRNLLLKYNVTLTLNEPTRITLKSQTCIDNIITNLKSYTAKVAHLGLSDHSAQIIEIPCCKSYDEKYWYICKSSIDSYMKIFLKYISQVSFSEVYLQSNVNLAYGVFINIFKMIFDLCIPIKRIKMTYNKNWAHWQTRGIYRASKTKRKIYHKIINKKNTQLLPYYKKYCKVLKTVTKIAKQKYNIRFIKNSINKQKATWEIIKKQTATINNIKTTVENIIVNDIYIDEASTIAETFNEHFITMNTQDIDSNSYYASNSIRSCKSIYLLPVDITELHKTVTNLKSKKSCGFDNIPITIIKKSIKFISEPLIYILNLMLETGTFPEDLKIAKIKPVFKKGCKSDIHNYRPIALLSNFSKIFEKIIYDRLLNYFYTNNLININQFGFQKNKSTTMAIFKFLKSMWDTVNDKIPCMGLFLDMSRAFDCVVHDILLAQLETIGVRGVALELIKSYLENRKQFTVIDTYNKKTKTIQHIQSNTGKVILGVPQGSVLGPLLFLVYVNELPNTINHLCVMFADDATVFISDASKNINQFQNEITNTLRILINWLRTLNLKVNLSKTKILQFRNYKSKPVDISINVSDNTIEQVNEINFLGVTIDSHLTWKSHISKINTKISSWCYALSILVETTSISTARTAYFGHVYPLLTYGIIFWGNSVNVKSTFILQKKCLRIIHSMYADESLRNVFKENKYLTLTNIYIFELCVFVKQNMDYFMTKTEFRSRYDVRDLYKFDLCVKQVKNNIYKKGAFNTGIKVYNHLPLDIKSLDVRKFKSKLKDWLFKNVFYDLKEYFDSQT